MNLRTAFHVLQNTRELHLSESSRQLTPFFNNLRFRSYNYLKQDNWNMYSHSTLALSRIHPPYLPRTAWRLPLRLHYSRAIQQQKLVRSPYCAVHREKAAFYSCFVFWDPFFLNKDIHHRLPWYQWHLSTIPGGYWPTWGMTSNFLANYFKPSWQPQFWVSPSGNVFAVVRHMSQHHKRQRESLQSSLCFPSPFSFPRQEASTDTNRKPVSISLPSCSLPEKKVLISTENLRRKSCANFTPR